jgi:hypothetical protein
MRTFNNFILSAGIYLYIYINGIVSKDKQVNYFNMVCLKNLGEEQCSPYIYLNSHIVI